MRKRQRIREPADFRSLFRFGKKAESAHFRAHFSKNRLGFLRLAVVVPSSVDKRATVRNRLRRRAREYLRRDKKLLSEALDLALAVKKPAATLSRREFYGELDKIIRRIS